MLKDITSGNAKADGSEFNYWFVGTVEKWCSEKGIPFDSQKYGLRNAGDIEIKWGRYKKDDERDIWAGCSEKTAMSILIRGDFTFIFRDADNHENRKEACLQKEGDYVIWREDVEHTWRMDEDSEILTLRWSSKEQ